MTDDKYSHRVCHRSRSLSSSAVRRANCSSRSRQSVGSRAASPLAAVDRLQKKLARLHDREKDISSLLASVSVHGHSDVTPRITRKTCAKSSSSGCDPSQDASSNPTPSRCASESCLFTRSASARKDCLQAHSEVIRARSDTLAPVERALSELRQAMATLPVHGHGPSRMQEHMSQHTGLHLSTAEASLAKAMECLDASLVPPPLKHSGPATTPPRMTRVEYFTSPSPVSTASKKMASGRSNHHSFKAKDVHSDELVDLGADLHSPVSPTIAVAEISNSIKTSRGRCNSKCSTMSPSEASCFSTSPSLASSLSIFDPPTPEPQQQLVAALVQTREELETLAEAARRAAVVCPDSTPLVEALCTAISVELKDLQIWRVVGMNQSELDVESILNSDRKLFELRSAIVEGMEALQVALEHCSNPRVDERYCPRTNSPMHSCANSLLGKNAMQTDPSIESSVVKMFGEVASNMMQAVQEIREAKTRQAAARKHDFPVPRRRHA